MTSRSFSFERGTASGLRAVIQVRRVATELSAAAERELAQRPEALNSRLLVHALSPMKMWSEYPTPGSVARLAIHDFAIVVPRFTMRSSPASACEVLARTIHSVGA